MPIDDKIKIGLMFPTSGTQSWAGLECIEAAEIALAIAEEDGLIQPGQVELLKGDVHSSETAATEARRFIAQGAKILHGTILSSWVPPAAKIAQDNGVLYLEAIAASEEIHQYNFGNFFRVNVDCLSYGEGIAEFIANVLAPAWNLPVDRVRVATVYQSDSFCQSLVESFSKKALAKGMRIVDRQLVNQTESDFRPVIRSLMAKQVDVLVVATYRGPTPNFWVQAVDEHFLPRAFFGTGSWALGQYVKQIGDLANGLCAVGTPHIVAIKTSALSADAKQYLAKWKKRTGKQHTDRTAVDRDLVMIALRVLFERVLPRASSLRLDDLRKALLAVDIPMGSTILGYGVKFSESGDNTRSFPAIMQWQQGRLETIYPSIISTKIPWTTTLSELSTSPRHD